MALPYLPTPVAINSGGVVDQIWIQYFLEELGQLTSLTTTVNAIPGVNNFTVATQPALGPADAGYLGWLTDYKHFLRWDGTTWEFFGDSGNGFFADYAIIPQTGLWQLCDGTATKYLTLGATLTETSFTTPDLISTPAYKKAAAAYTGTINAKAGTTGTGTTGTDITGDTAPGLTGNTDDESAHTHSVTEPSVPIIGGGGGIAFGGATFAIQTTASTVTSGAGSAHHHGVSAVSVNAHNHTVPSLSVPALNVGSIEMANLGVLPYFRR